MSITVFIITNLALVVYEVEVLPHIVVSDLTLDVMSHVTLGVKSR